MKKKKISNSNNKDVDYDKLEKLLDKIDGVLKKNKLHSDTDILDDPSLTSISQLIIHNDETNTFDYVIKCIVQYCRYDVIRAEQLVVIIHNKKKAIVKTNMKKILLPIKDAFVDAGISATIETIDT